MQHKPKQILVWRPDGYVVKTLPLSKGGRVGRTTSNNAEATALYERWAREQKEGRKDGL